MSRSGLAPVASQHCPSSAFSDRSSRRRFVIVGKRWATTEDLRLRWALVRQPCSDAAISKCARVTGEEHVEHVVTIAPIPKLFDDLNVSADKETLAPEDFSKVSSAFF